MQIQHSKDAQKILGHILAQGEINNAQVVFSLPLPHAEWWEIISDAARDTNGDPYRVAVNGIRRARETNPTLPSWPPGMYEKEDNLPAITKDEAIAIIDRFLLAENSPLTSGKLLYLLQWDVLAAEYCPLRERYSVLKELVSEGILLETSAELPENESNLKWPLCATDKAISEIKNVRLKAKFPTFFRIEAFLSNIRRNYPETIRVIVWLLLGGGFFKIFEYIFRVIFQ